MKETIKPTSCRTCI